MTPHPTAHHSSGPEVLIVSGSFGAGHDRAADQIAWRLREQGMATRQVDLVDFMQRGNLLRALYRTQIHQLPATWDLLMRACSHASGVRAANRVVLAAAGRLHEAIHPRTVAVVSTYPLASQILGHLRRTGQLTIPVITFLTDMSVHRLWVAPEVDHHWAIHPVAARQAAALGAQRVTVTGPLVAPHFQPPSPRQRAHARHLLKLPDGQRVALVVTGSWGVGDFARTAHDIHATGAATPVIACGQNTTARHRLTAAGFHALGWIDDMTSVLYAADVVVQSGGGMTSLEARAAGVPVITYRSLAGHGRMSAAALDEAGWAPWARDRAQLARLLRDPGPVTPAGPSADIATLVAHATGQRPVLSAL